MVSIALTLMLLTAGDEPRLVTVEDQRVDLEAMHHAIRMLDAQILATATRLPLAYVGGMIASFATGLALTSLALVISFVARGVSPVLLIALFAVALTTFISGFVWLEAGMRAGERGVHRRIELERRRDEAVRRLQEVQSSAAPELTPIASF